MQLAQSQFPYGMTVDGFAAKLRPENLVFVDDGQYRNKIGRIGYWALYKDSHLYYKFSISNTDATFALNEVAHAITVSDRIIRRENTYQNRREAWGFEATVLSGGHAYMLTASVLYRWNMT
ncbi:MAG: hypothetical protein WAM91_01940 [Candidatus Acidiferrales bacterium]